MVGQFPVHPGPLDNTGTGVIHVTAGAGGGRSITGDLTNEGTLRWTPTPPWRSTALP